MSQNCVNHPEVKSAGQCSYCGKELFRLCIHPSGTQLFCGEDCELAGQAQAEAAIKTEPSMTRIKVKLAIMLILIISLLGLAYLYVDMLNKNGF